MVANPVYCTKHDAHIVAHVFSAMRAIFRLGAERGKGGVCYTPRLCRRRGLLSSAPHGLGPPQHGFLKCLEMEEEPLFELVGRLPTFHTERGKDLGIKLPTGLRNDGIRCSFGFNK